MTKIKIYISKDAEFLGFGKKKSHKFGFTQAQKFTPCEYSIKGYEDKIKIYKNDGFWWVDYKGSHSRSRDCYRLVSQAKKTAVKLIQMGCA
jgi:hypothetical protein